MDDVVDSPESRQSDRSPRRRPRRILPRFGLRSLFVFAIFFCLLFGWVGRNLYRVRQEQAAVEALKQAGAKFMVRGGSVGPAWVEAQPLEDYDFSRRLFGWTDRPSLSMVVIESSKIDDPHADAAVASLSVFPTLESVSLTGPAFDDAALERLASLPRLRALSLCDTEVTGSGIARLGPPLKIRAIALSYEHATSELIEALAALPDLEALSVQEAAPVEPLSYAALERMIRLKTFYVVGSGIEDEDMTTLAKLEGLEELTLNGVTDVGLRHLDPLTKLTRINLHLPVTTEAARQFSASHPGCSVTHRDGEATTYLAGEIVP